MKVTMRPVRALPKIIIHRKVAAYCRASTKQEIQCHSLEVQLCCAQTGRDSFAFSPLAKIVVSPPSSRWRPTVHRTVGFILSSPLSHEVRKKTEDTLWVSSAFFGTPEGTRTPNPRNRNPMLYPLSHRCMCLCIITGFLPFVKGKMCIPCQHFLCATVD